ncbi:hypothetical protein NOX90_06510 [Wolbachia endosymbiont of Anurida maritima]|uniref:hypothetical protein n=1 Tax=Wolbachia endosymbiont of Anurida maritima TaxID=2850562 RepID=UPI0035D0AB03
MVFIINGECDMALNEELHGKTEQDLIDDGDFINALVRKLTAGAGDNGVYTKTAADTALAGKANTAALDTKVNVTGDNLQLPAFVAALAVGAGDNGVYTKTAADTALAGKANTAALDTKVNVTGDNLQLPAFVAALAVGAGDNGVYTKTAADTALAGKANTAALDTKVNVTGDNLQLPAFVAALAVGAGDNGVYTKTAADTALAGKANTADVYTKGIADTSFVKTDGTNANNILARLAVPTADDVASVLRGNSTFINAIKTHANAEDAGFQGAVKNVMSQQHFEIPDAADVPISVDW